jgi:hypothetical protein
MPVSVIMNPKTALLGAARHAAFELGNHGEDEEIMGHRTRSGLKGSQKGNH